MARLCSHCERSPLTGNTRSHSNIATKRRRLVNLQSRRHSGGTSLVCTSCMRTLRKQKNRD